MSKGNKLGVACLRGIFVLLWLLLIYYFSDQANSNVLTESVFGSFNYIVRKAAHMAEYAVLMFLCLYFQAALTSAGNLEAGGLLGGILRYILPFTFTVLSALFDEWHQSWVAGRSALISDVLIDGSGAFLAACLHSFKLSLKKLH